MKLLTTDDLGRRLIKAVGLIDNGDQSDEQKRADLAGTARAFAILFELTLDGLLVAGEGTGAIDKKDC